MSSFDRSHIEVTAFHNDYDPIMYRLEDNERYMYWTGLARTDSVLAVGQHAVCAGESIPVPT